MTVPTGYLFRPTDQELLLKYLDKKCTNEALPCGVVIDCEIYGAGDKVPWQIFTDQKEDPWEICKTKDKRTDYGRQKLTVEELEAIWEEEEHGGYSPWHCDNSALVPLDSNTATSNTNFNFHMPAAYRQSAPPVVD
ncbi:hypothetical protein RHSIM_Rhsim02G0204400 [Rhododendron simsii]|uniref:NAC domain-containing protein n=1 Tax=Rhododendron simsii TaxID=118357 RepID=A0A834LSY0_RHOSS|nr:hypothetical protein RHSIM_Rhsim02G0204400 [Rhododendron simsii]